MRIGAHIVTFLSLGLVAVACGGDDKKNSGDTAVGPLETVSCGSLPAVSDTSLPIYGNWLAFDGEKGGIRFQAVVTFKKDTVVNRVTCTFPNGKSLCVEATSNATVTGSTYEITASSSNEVSSGGSDCDVGQKVTPTLSYTVSGDILTTSYSDGSVEKATRIK